MAINEIGSGVGLRIPEFDFKPKFSIPSFSNINSSTNIPSSRSNKTLGLIGGGLAAAGIVGSLAFGRDDEEFISEILNLENELQKLERNRQRLRSEANLSGLSVFSGSGLGGTSLARSFAADQASKIDAKFAEEISNVIQRISEIKAQYAATRPSTAEQLFRGIADIGGSLLIGGLL